MMNSQPSRMRMCCSRLLLAPLLFICGECFGQYQGEGILNLVEVGEDYKLEDIKEIKYFTALYTEGNSDLAFMLALDDEVPLDHPDSATTPTLFLNMDGGNLASVHLPVSYSKEEQAHILSWHAVPTIADESFCLVQVYPNREQVATLKIPFSIATIKRFDKDAKVHQMTFDEVRKRIHQHRKKKDQDKGSSAAGEVDHQQHDRRVKKIMISPKGEDSPRKVTLHTLAVGVFDDDGKFRPASSMPYKIGAEFGYELGVYSPKGKVHVKEVLDLPAPGVWEDGETEEAELKGVKFLNVITENDNKTHIQEYELPGGKKGATFGQVYEIVEGDPKGTYRFTIYLNGQLAETSEIEVGKD